MVCRWHCRSGINSGAGYRYAEISARSFFEIVNEAINSIVGIFSGILGGSDKGVQASTNVYNNPVYTSESEVMPLVYVYLILAVALVLFGVFAATAKK